MEENKNLNKLPELPKKKKFRKLKIFSIIFILLIGISLVVLYSDYSKSINQQKEEVIKNLDKQVELGELKRVEVTNNEDLTIRNPLTKVNPRWSYQNVSGTEIAYVDHLGNMEGIGNISFTNSVNGFLFVRQIGSQVTKITAGYFTNLYTDFLNSTNINSTTLFKGGNPVNSTSELDTKYQPTGSYLTSETDPTWSTNLTSGIDAPVIIKNNLNVTGNITLTNNNTICFNPSCSSYIQNNGSNLIIKS